MTRASLTSPGTALILTNLLIVPLRCKKTARAYKKITTPQGPPLLVNSRKLQHAVINELGNDYQVELAMRYSQPTIETALKNLAHCNRLIAIPLFPQYSSAATGSAIAELLHELAKQWNIPDIKIIHDFFNNAGFIQAYSEIIKTTIGDKNLNSFYSVIMAYLNDTSIKAAARKR